MMRRLIGIVVSALFMCGWFARADEESAISPLGESTALSFTPTPSFSETFSAKSVHNFPAVISPKFSLMVASAQQPVGALSGRVVFMNSGHGWTWNTGNFWYLQRPTALNSMNEDYGNWDQLNFLQNTVSTPVRPLSRCVRWVSRPMKSCWTTSARA